MNDLRHRITEESMQPDDSKTAPVSPRKYKILYKLVLLYTYWHLGGFYGLYLLFTDAQWRTILFTWLTYSAANIGVTVGAHRLWSHRAFKARLPLQILLMIFQCISLENSALHWARDHRLHHKHSDTDADPHNSLRGIFFSHIGWLVVQKHPESIERGKNIDMSDLYNDPVLSFQKRYAFLLITISAFVLPTLIPIYYWNETLNVAWHLVLLRITAIHNATFLINSAAHAFGTKPYDKNILARQNTILSFITGGEGFHNYHHVFPWDYRAAEFGNNKVNVSTKFIDFCAWIGLAYDLKTVPDEMIAKKAQKTGDGSNLWGWGDKDLKKEDDVYFGWDDDYNERKNYVDDNILYSYTRTKEF